tara:strand:- start:214 stop:459 length:246 start_codon:yes stop_codon:yes gene_type:complete
VPKRYPQAPALERYKVIPPDSTSKLKPLQLSLMGAQLYIEGDDDQVLMCNNWFRDLKGRIKEEDIKIQILRESMTVKTVNE